MKAKLTGSRVYGNPTENSDVDLLIYLPSNESKVLKDSADEIKIPQENWSSTSLRYSNLNIILCHDLETYETWKEGTLRLEEFFRQVD